MTVRSFAGAVAHRPRSVPPLRLFGVSAGVAAFALIPLFFIAYYVYDAGWEQIRLLVFRPLIGELLLNTLALCALATAACAALGLALALVIERTTLPLASLWIALLSAPLAVPAFINSYAWITVQPQLDGLKAATIVTTLSYYPFVLLPVIATLRRLDPALEESARSMGLGAMATFRRVVLPQLRVPLLGGSLLVSLHLLAEYGAIEQLRFPTFTTAIIAQYESTFASTAANMLAAVLVLCCLAFVALESAARGRGRMDRLGSGAPRSAPKASLGWWTAPAIAALLGLIALSVGVPGYSIAKWLNFGGASVWDWSAMQEALGSTIRLSAIAAAVAVTAAFPVAWLAVRHRCAATTALERTTYLSSALPGVVVGLALVTASIRYARPLYQSTTLIIAAYVMLFLPRAMVSLRAAIGQAPPALEEASRALGSSAIGTFRRVVVPLTTPGIVSGMALVFLAVSTELTATLLLAPTGTHTLATEFWAASSEIDYPRAAPYAAMLVVLSVPATLLLIRQAQRTATT